MEEKETYYHDGSNSLLTSDSASAPLLRLALYAIDRDKLSLLQIVLELPCQAKMTYLRENLHLQELKKWQLEERKLKEEALYAVLVAFRNQHAPLQSYTPKMLQTLNQSLDEAVQTFYVEYERDYIHARFKDRHGMQTPHRKYRKEDYAAYLTDLSLVPPQEEIRSGCMAYHAQILALGTRLRLDEHIRAMEDNIERFSSELDDFVEATGVYTAPTPVFLTYKSGYQAHKQTELAAKTLKIDQIFSSEDVGTVCAILECDDAAAAKRLLLTPPGLVSAPKPVPIFRELDGPWGQTSLFEYVQLVQPKQILSYLCGIRAQLVNDSPAGVAHQTYNRVWRQQLFKKLLRCSVSDVGVISFLHRFRFDPLKDVLDILPEDKPLMAYVLGRDLGQELFYRSRVPDKRLVDQDMLLHLFRESHIPSGFKQGLMLSYLGIYGRDDLTWCRIVVLSHPHPLSGNQQADIRAGKYLIVQRKDDGTFALTFFNKTTQALEEHQIGEEDILAVLSSVPDDELRHPWLQDKLFELTTFLGGDTRFKDARDFAQEMCFYLRAKLCDALDDHHVDNTKQKVPKDCVRALETLAFLEGCSVEEAMLRIDQLWNLLHELEERHTNFITYSVFQFLKNALMKCDGARSFVALEQFLDRLPHIQEIILPEEKALEAKEEKQYFCEFINQPLTFAGKTFYASNHMDADNSGFEVLRVTREDLVFELLQTLHEATQASKDLSEALGRDYAALLLAGALDDIATPADLAAKESQDNMVRQRHCQDIKHLSHFVKFYIGGRGALPLSAAKWYAEHKIACHFFEQHGSGGIVGNYFKEVELPVPADEKKNDDNDERNKAGQGRWGRVLVHYPSDNAHKPHYAHFVPVEDDEDSFNAITFNRGRRGETQLLILGCYLACLRYVYLNVSEGLQQEAHAVAAERVGNFFKGADVWRAEHQAAVAVGDVVISLLHKPVFFEIGKPGVVGATHNQLLDIIQKPVTGREIEFQIRQQMIILQPSAPTAADKERIMSGELLIIFKNDGGDFSLGYCDASNNYQERSIEDLALADRLKSIENGPIHDSCFEDGTPVRDMIFALYQPYAHYEHYTPRWGGPAYSNQFSIDVSGFSAQTSRALNRLLRTDQVPLTVEQRGMSQRIRSRLPNFHNPSAFESAMRRPSMQADIQQLQAQLLLMDRAHTQMEEVSHVSTLLDVMMVQDNDSKHDTTQLVPSSGISLDATQLPSERLSERLDEFFKMLCEEMYSLERNYAQTKQQMIALTNRMPVVRQQLNSVAFRYQVGSRPAITAEARDAKEDRAPSKIRNREEVGVFLTNYYQEQVASITEGCEKFAQYLAQMVYVYRCIATGGGDLDGLLDWLDRNIMPDGRSYAVPPSPTLTLITGKATCVQLMSCSGYRLYQLNAQDQPPEELRYVVLSDNVSDKDVAIDKYGCKTATLKQVQQFTIEQREARARDTWYKRYSQTFWLNENSREGYQHQRSQYAPITDEFRDPKVVRAEAEDARIAAAVAQKWAERGGGSNETQLQTAPAGQDQVVSNLTEQLATQATQYQQEVENLRQTIQTQAAQLQAQPQLEPAEMENLRGTIQAQAGQLQAQETEMGNMRGTMQAQAAVLTDLRAMMEILMRQQGQQQPPPGSGGPGVV